MRPQIHDPSMSASQGLGLKACATMPDRTVYFSPMGRGVGGYNFVNYSLDWTTACVCSDVPDAMFVKAHAASNCKEGLRTKSKRF